jgi:hypothetical protein
MKHRVNFRRRWQFQLISYKAHFLEDIEGTIEMRCQLESTPSDNRVLAVRLKMEVDLLSNLELALTPSQIRILLHVMLSLLHVMTKESDKLCSIL